MASRRSGLSLFRLWSRYFFGSRSRTSTFPTRLATPVPSPRESLRFTIGSPGEPVLESREESTAKNTSWRAIRCRFSCVRFSRLLSARAQLLSGAPRLCPDPPAKILPNRPVADVLSVPTPSSRESASERRDHRQFLSSSPADCPLQSQTDETHAHYRCFPLVDFNGVVSLRTGGRIFSNCCTVSRAFSASRYRPVSSFSCPLTVLRAIVGALDRAAPSHRLRHRRSLWVSSRRLLPSR